MDKSTELNDFLPSAMVLLLGLLMPYFFAAHLHPLAPPFGFAAIFFWLRQDEEPRLSLPIIAICGLLLDITQAMPIGVGLSASLLLYILAKRRSNRDKSSNFDGHNLRHIAVSAIVMTWIYLLMSFVKGSLLPIEAPLFQWLALIISYPLIYTLCHIIVKSPKTYSAIPLK